MIALFEPSILTAPARIRLMVPELWYSRRRLDMIVLTCMLVVTHPTDWRRHQASARPSSPSSPRPTVSRQQSLSEERGRHSTQSVDLQRAPSHDEVRTATPVYRTSTDSHSSLSSVESGSSSQQTPTPTIGQTTPGRITPPLVLSRLMIPTSTPEDAPITPTPLTAVRRVYSVDGLRTPTSRSLPTTPSNVLTIISRSNTIDGRRHTLHRSPSAHPLSRYSIESDLSSASNSPSVADGYEFTPSGRRPWEYVDAYPMPYAVVQPSTPVINADSNLPEASPPPYSRRDPLASPTPRSPRPSLHRRTSSTPRPERSVQLVLVS